MSNDLTKAEHVDVTSVRSAITVEEALGISPNRFLHLGFTFDEIFNKYPAKAEMILAVANLKDVTDLEKTYLGYKIHERFCMRRVPFWRMISRGV